MVDPIMLLLGHEKNATWDISILSGRPTIVVLGCDAVCVWVCVCVWVSPRGCFETVAGSQTIAPHAHLRVPQTTSLKDRNGFKVAAETSWSSFYTK